MPGGRIEPGKPGKTRNYTITIQLRQLIHSRTLGDVVRSNLKFTVRVCVVTFGDEITYGHKELLTMMKRQVWGDGEIQIIIPPLSRVSTQYEN